MPEKASSNKTGQPIESTTEPVPEPLPPLNPTEEKFDNAIKAGVATYNWMPPKFLPLMRTESQRDRFPIKIEDQIAQCEARAQRPHEHAAGKDHLHKKEDRIQNVPHPLSDFDHDDDALPKTEEELLDLPLAQVEAFRRMEAAFKWIVCRAGSLLAEINEAAKDVALNNLPVDRYDTARNEYIEFLRNVKNRHPKPSEIDPMRGFGFGKNFTYVHVDPVVDEKEFGTPPKKVFVVTGLTVVAEWNPHVSSAGVPVKHS